MKIFKSVAVLSLLLLSSLASADSVLKNSTPENGAMLSKAPEDLMLEFTIPVKLVKLQLMEQSEKTIKLITEPSENFETTLNIALPMLDTGSYKIRWVALGIHAHKMQGDFTFTVHASDMEKMPASSDEQNPEYD